MQKSESKMTKKVFAQNLESSFNHFNYKNQIQLVKKKKKPLTGAGWRLRNTKSKKSGVSKSQQAISTLREGKIHTHTKEKKRKEKEAWDLLRLIHGCLCFDFGTRIFSSLLLGLLTNLAANVREEASIGLACLFFVTE